MATLAEHGDAFGEIWHLPAAEPLTGRQFARLVFEELRMPPRIGVIPRPVMLLGSLFSPMIRESAEVLYQFEYPFIMDAGKFSSAFGSRITPTREAIRHTLGAVLRPRKNSP